MMFKNTFKLSDNLKLTNEKAYPFVQIGATFQFYAFWFWKR